MPKDTPRPNRTALVDAVSKAAGPMPGTQSNTVNVDVKHQIEALQAQRNAALDEIARQAMMVRGLQAKIQEQAQYIAKLEANAGPDQ